MSKVSKDDLTKQSTALDLLWQEAFQIVGAHFKEFDPDFANGRAKRNIEIQRYVSQMAVIVRELLDTSIYFADTRQRDTYELLESTLVRNISRITRLDADTGIAYKKQFLEYSRSISAEIKIRTRSVSARMGFWLDDGFRAK